jgi:hypothetical protein
MKKASNILRQISASVLMSIYVAFWAWMSLHHFILHDHHHEQKVCHHAPSEKHLHSEEYAGLDCSLCQLAPVLAEPPAFSVPVLHLPEFVQIKPVFGERSFLSATPHTLSQPRAPPVRPA